MRRFYEREQTLTPSAMRTREVIETVRRQEAARQGMQRGREAAMAVRLKKSQEAFTASLADRYAPDKLSREEYELRERMAARRASRALPWNVDAAEERLARIRSGRGRFDIGNMMRGAGRELSHQGSQFGLPMVGLGLGPIAAGIGAVGAVGFMKYEFEQQQMQRMEEQRMRKIEPAAAQRMMRLNYDLGNLAGFEGKMNAISSRLGVKLTDVFANAADALSAAGSLTEDKIVGAVEAGTSLFPHDADASRSVSGGVMDLMKVAEARGIKMTPEDIAGRIIKKLRSSRLCRSVNTGKRRGPRRCPRDVCSYRRLSRVAEQQAMNGYVGSCRTLERSRTGAGVCP